MNNLLEQAFMQVNIGIIAIDRQYNIVLCNQFVSDFSKKSVDELTHHNLFEAFPKLPKNWLQRRIDHIFLLKNSSFISWEQRPSLFDLLNSRPITGSTEKMIQNCSLFPVSDEQRNVSHVCITISDATAIAVNQLQLKQTYQRLFAEKKEQQKLIKKLEETKNQLLQSEKMASIGQLAAGVAHEINNPVGFIKSNFSSLKHYAASLNTVINQYEVMLKSFSDEATQQKMTVLAEEHDLCFILEDIDNLLVESFDGISRIEDIVKSLKHFSRADSHRWEAADINQGLESTLRVVAHELKYIAHVEKDFADLPLVECLPMQLNQVFMNLLVNAGQAIDKSNKGGKISVITRLNADDKVVIAIGDNGKGISEDTIHKIFDPFYTTKPVGEGTGLGLSLSYSIVEKHSGTITVDSELGRGTLFTISLPIKQKVVNE